MYGLAETCDEATTAGTSLSTKLRGWSPGRWTLLIDWSCRSTRELSITCHLRAALGYLVLTRAALREDRCVPCTGARAASRHPSKLFLCRYEGRMSVGLCSHYVHKSDQGHFASVALLPLHSPVFVVHALLAMYQVTTRTRGRAWEGLARHGKRNGSSLARVEASRRGGGKDRSSLLRGTNLALVVDCR